MENCLLDEAVQEMIWLYCLDVNIVKEQILRANYDYSQYSTELFHLCKRNSADGTNHKINSPFEGSVLKFVNNFTPEQSSGTNNKIPFFIPKNLSMNLLRRFCFYILRLISDIPHFLEFNLSQNDHLIDIKSECISNKYIEETMSLVKTEFVKQKIDLEFSINKSGQLIVQLNVVKKIKTHTIPTETFYAFPDQNYSINLANFVLDTQYNSFNYKYLKKLKYFPGQMEEKENPMSDARIFFTQKFSPKVKNFFFYDFSKRILTKDRTLKIYLFFTYIIYEVYSNKKNHNIITCPFIRKKGEIANYQNINNPFSILDDLSNQSTFFFHLFICHVMKLDPNAIYDYLFQILTEKKQNYLNIPYYLYLWIRFYYSEFKMCYSYKTKENKDILDINFFPPETIVIGKDYSKVNIIKALKEIVDTDDVDFHYFNSYITYYTPEIPINYNKPIFSFKPLDVYKFFSYYEYDLITHVQFEDLMCILSDSFTTESFFELNSIKTLFKRTDDTIIYIQKSLINSDGKYDMQNIKFWLNILFYCVDGKIHNDLALYNFQLMFEIHTAFSLIKFTSSDEYRQLENDNRNLANFLKRANNLFSLSSKNNFYEEYFKTIYEKGSIKTIPCFHPYISILLLIRKKIEEKNDVVLFKQYNYFSSILQIMFWNWGFSTLNQSTQIDGTYKSFISPECSSEVSMENQDLLYLVGKLEYTT